MDEKERLRLKAAFPLVSALCKLEPVTWINTSATQAAEGLTYVGLSAAQVEDAAARLQRFAPWLVRAFPETAPAGGIIESELVALTRIGRVLNARYGTGAGGRLLLKKDSHLPIAGSIKARGGIYEVLAHAERLAMQAGLLQESDDYGKLDSDAFRTFFSRYRIAVGSTGNLGLSIGIVSARLGFSVSVHMSADARAWKKQKLREHGVSVIEYAQDYGMAVEQGRREAASDPDCFFIDDENSRTLFLGYAVAGDRLKQQLARQQIRVDKTHPLFVYLPCGVGGAPGGVAFGLKLAFGDNVHLFFAEPTHSPSMLLGVYTGLHDKIAVQDLGIDNQTAADGLAVGRPSGFVGPAMMRLLCGFFTLSDQEMYDLLALMAREEQLLLEPSALAGLPGPWRLRQHAGALAAQGISEEMLTKGTHVVWATGGGMVPDDEWETYLSASVL
ncbi:D-serine ammonia-lyase [Pantoea sp. FN060301]|uniref:D-serine ammonia-lyase n=1 Tax=Pantoea sp. FN060301 TaxID=3420380 RepID=UPI003D185373